MAVGNIVKERKKNDPRLIMHSFRISETVETSFFFLRLAVSRGSLCEIILERVAAGNGSKNSE